MISQGAATSKRKRGPGKPFQKGASGNPKGRKPVPPEVKAILSAACPRAAERLVELIEDPDPSVALKAAQVVIERIHGKPVQALEHSGADGVPISIVINRVVKQPTPSGSDPGN